MQERYAVVFRKLSKIGINFCFLDKISELANQDSEL